MPAGDTRICRSGEPNELTRAERRVLIGEVATHADGGECDLMTAAAIERSAIRKRKKRFAATLDILRARD